MMRRISDDRNDQEVRVLMKSPMVLCCFLVVVFFLLNSCSNQPPSPPVKAVQKGSAKNTPKTTVPSQPLSVEEEKSEQEGYVYERRDRVDPFVPLIVPKKKADKGKGIKVGTPEGYDISEFTLAAIAKVGRGYYALLTTPDNRSFSVHNGTPIGLNNGKVKNISRDKIVLVEYSKDFRGTLMPREIILEFHKGEVE